MELKMETVNNEFKNEATNTMLQSESFPADAEEASDSDKELDSELYFGLNDEPPWYLTILLSFQHYVTMASAAMSYPIILGPILCLAADDVHVAELCSTIMFVSGICTLLQSTLGTRLPIIQGGSFAFMVPTIAILTTEKYRCPPGVSSLTELERQEHFYVRIREIQGAILVASLVEIFLGLFGIVGMLLKYITPLTVASAITMLGISLFRASAASSSSNWFIALLTIFLIILFSQYLKKMKIPIPKMMQQRNSTKKFDSVPIFEVFPVLLAIVIVWILCLILTISDVLPVGSPARTDYKAKIIEQSSWFKVPYPFQWGMPTIALGSFLGLLCSVLTGTVESIGDYIACSEIVAPTRPPTNAMNRGIFMEGLGVFVDGLFGTCTGTASYSSSIGALAITRVGARSVVQGAGIFMLLFGMIGKVGAIFVTIPEPILGGVFCVLFAILMGVGLSNLGDVNLKSQRNLFVIGFSVFFGLTVSEWVAENEDQINSGYETFDQVMIILLKTGMFLSGLLGFCLDNTISGTDKERGLISWSSHGHKLNQTEFSLLRDQTYDFPIGMSFIKRYKILKRLPISPTYEMK